MQRLLLEIETLQRAASIVGAAAARQDENEAETEAQGQGEASAEGDSEAEGQAEAAPVDRRGESGDRQADEGVLGEAEEGHGVARSPAPLLRCFAVTRHALSPTLPSSSSYTAPAGVAAGGLSSTDSPTPV